MRAPQKNSSKESSMQEKRVTERKDAKMAELGNAHMHDSIASKLRAEKKKNLNLAYLREKHREPVKGVFRYYEVPQGVLRFVFHEFEGDPIQKYTLYDGHVYTLPLGVAKHLNKNCWYPVHEHERDEDDQVSMRIGQRIHRCGFQSLEFHDIDDFSSQAAKSIEVVSSS